MVDVESTDSRNAMQKIALSAIYDALTYISMNEAVDVEHIVSSLCGKPYEACDPFIKGAVIFAIKHHDEAIAAFNAKMNNWTFDRLNRVEQAILLLAYVHFYYLEENVDKGVVIDVAVRQAKTFLGDKDYKFVNAILDNVLQK